MGSISFLFRMTRGDARTRLGTVSARIHEGYLTVASPSLPILTVKLEIKLRAKRDVSALMARSRTAAKGSNQRLTKANG